MNEHRTAIISTLREIADDYNILCIASENQQFISFYNKEVEFLAPNFSLFIDWDKCQVDIMNVNKQFGLDKIEGYVRLMAEVIS
jgi:hypothetical protein